MSICKETACDSRVVAWGMCDKHYRRWRKGLPPEPPERTWDDVMASLRQRVHQRVSIAASDCWEWPGHRNAGGYGLITGKLKGVSRGFLVHRLMYGNIPDGLELDHLCRNKVCCNPAHLEPVTRAENQRRRASLITHCPKGHEYSDANTRVRSGKRSCRRCQADSAWARRNPGAAMDDPRRRGAYIA